MQLDSISHLITSKKFRILAPFIMILFIVLVYALSTTSKVSPRDTIIPSPTPVSLSAINTNRVESNGYVVSYPKEFILQKNVGTNDLVKNFLYYQDNQPYAFQIIPGGTGGLQAYSQKVDTIQQKILYIQNRQFMESTWIYQRKPFFISVIPNEPSLPHIMYQIYLPENNTQHYIDLFNEILSQVQLPLSLRSRPNPVVTLQTPQTINE